MSVYLWTKRHLTHQKWLKTLNVLTHLTSKCASRHNGVHFFDIESPSNRQKVVRTPGVLCIFTWKCASRHNGVPFFHIATSKSGSELKCFVHFYFKMCFVPHRRALFQHLNFQKSPGRDSFSNFSLPNDFLPVWASSWLCFFICPYCRKFRFQTSFEH